MTSLRPCSRICGCRRLRGALKGVIPLFCFSVSQDVADESLRHDPPQVWKCGHLSWFLNSGAYGSSQVKSCHWNFNVQSSHPIPTKNLGWIWESSFLTGPQVKPVLQVHNQHLEQRGSEPGGFCFCWVLESPSLFHKMLMPWPGPQAFWLNRAMV